MKKRIAIFSPSQHSFLMGFEWYLNNEKIATKEELEQRRQLLYSTMIQAGVDQLDVGINPFEENVEGPLSTRIKNMPFDKVWTEYHNILDEVFATDLKNEEDDNASLDFRIMKMFIADLLYALNKKRSLVIIPGIPNITQYDGKFSVSNIIPLQNLIDTITTIENDLPVTRHNLTHNSIIKYEEILTSSLFEKYRTNSSMLEASTNNQNTVLENIRDSASHLVSHNSRLLKLRKARISILNIGTKIIDVVFGSLPGKLADVATSLATNAIQDDFRLTIYDMSNKIHDIYKFDKSSKSKKSK